MDKIYKIQEALEDRIGVGQALAMAKSMGIDAHIEDGMIVLDGIVITHVDGKDPIVAKEASIAEALAAAMEREAAVYDAEFMPAVIAIKAFNPAFDGSGYMYEVNTQWRTELLQEPEPPCSEPEHEWTAPIEVVGGVRENPGVWANSFGGVSITEICPHCGMTKYTDTIWTHPATGTTWEGVVRYDAQANRDAALQWAASHAILSE